MENYEEEKAHELVEDVTAADNIISSCCAGKVYAPSDEWAKCLTCFEYCDIITLEE